MSAVTTIEITEHGVFLPRRLLQSFGEIEIVQGKDYILIKPKNMTAHFTGFVKPHVAVRELHEAYELELLEGPTA